MKTPEEFVRLMWTEGDCDEGHHRALVETIAARDREVAEKVREACANVALRYDGKGLEHDQYTQLGDAGRTLEDIEGAIRALDLEEVLE